MGPAPEVRWDWPEGGGSPFDTSDAATRWVLVVGNTFGRTWPAGDLLDFGSWSTDFEKRVPMGYKTIRAAERLAVVDRGSVVREWPPTHQERPRPAYDPYQHHVAGHEPEGTFAVLDGRGSTRAPDGTWTRHEHDTYAAALTEARGMTDRRVLVVRLLTEKGWH